MKPVPEIAAGGRFQGPHGGWTWPDYSTRKKRNPDHRCALPGKLDTEERDELPDRAFALPKKRKYPLFSLQGGKLVPDPSHAKNAKARATQQYNAGKLSARQRDAIHRKANKVIAECRRDNPSDFAADWKVLDRAPAGLDGADVAELGRALELEAAGLRMRFTGRPGWYWEPRSRSVIVFQGGRRGNARKADDVDAKTERAFEAFMGRGVESQHSHTMPPIQGGVWRRAPGFAARFDYWSDKFDEDEEYTHGFTSRVRLYRGGGASPPWIWVLRGGRLRVTRRGIEG